ncbi:MAG: phosphopantetheine-binding protein [Crocinitomicaceae bacterium]|nr:phosphopantetheine-binding protein [Crocinitomicaceae bacterium]
MTEIIEALSDFIKSNILAKDIVLEPDFVLKEVGVDSFSIVEIVLFIERKYGKLIPDHLMVPETFRSVRSIATVVEDIIN